MMYSEYMFWSFFHVEGFIMDRMVEWTSFVTRLTRHSYSTSARRPVPSGFDSKIGLDFHIKSQILSVYRFKI
jgi:hypothetical protein